MQGWIKLYRKLTDWEWYDDAVVKAVFIDLLILANHQDNTWHGQTVKRGSLVTSLATIAGRNGLSIQQVRTALNKLEKTGEINKQTTNKNTLIIVLNYEQYQEFEDIENVNYQQTDNIQTTNNQQSNNNQSTTNKNVKNVNNDKNVRNIGVISNEITCQTETVRPSIQSIVDAWNSLQNDTAIKPISRMTSSSTRYKMLSTRLKEYNIDDVLKAIENIKQSDFLKGNNDKGWIITFDWFVKPNNFPKVLEGNYCNTVGAAESTQTKKPTATDEFMAKLAAIRERSINNGD